MTKRSWLAAILMVVALSATACASDPATPATTTAAAAGTSSAADSSSADSSIADSSSAGSSSAGSSADDTAGGLAVGESSLGPVIVDGAGLTAYYFDKDVKDSGVSACTGKCLAAWPTILTTSATPAADGITAAVGTITLPDGTLQVTVNGLPIYLFASDVAPGDVLGQGVNEVWWAISPNGDPIK